MRAEEITKGARARGNRDDNKDGDWSGRGAGAVVAARECNNLELAPSAGRAVAMALGLRGDG